VGRGEIKEKTGVTVRTRQLQLKPSAETELPTLGSLTEADSMDQHTGDCHLAEGVCYPTPYPHAHTAGHRAAAGRAKWQLHHCPEGQSGSTDSPQRRKAAPLRRHTGSGVLSMRNHHGLCQCV